jgi:glutamyl-tRNA reductase
MGDLSARHLRAAGIGELSVVNRTHVRALELAARLGGRALPWEELDQLLARVDIVLCSTGASQPLIAAEQVARAMRARKGRWLFFIDIAVPRAVAAEVGRMENVYLYDVDALDKVVDANRQDRARAAARAETMVERALRRFSAQERAFTVVPTIKQLRTHFLTVAQGEAERALRKWQPVGAAERQQVHALAEAIVNKLLHAPLTRLKREAGDGGDSELAAAAQALFDLTLDEDTDNNVVGLPARDQAER